MISALHHFEIFVFLNLKYPLTLLNKELGGLNHFSESVHLDSNAQIKYVIHRFIQVSAQICSVSITFFL